MVGQKIKNKNLQTSFSAFVETRRLTGFIHDEDFLAAFASSSAEVLPYQIAAARFAMRSPYLKGCILCDEGSLGKTYEALLIAAQKWYEGRENILVILPQNLVKQWAYKLEKDFTIPFVIWNNSLTPPDEDGIVITTYDYAVKRANAIKQIDWDLVIFDEADALSKPENKTVIALKDAVRESFKLLLTPTPITLSIMDIYGLIHFVDETILPDSDEFYKRYFRKPENYPELTSRVSQFCFRTLKSQVTQYVNFSHRIPITIDYPLTKEEKELYKMISTYLASDDKVAYPEMDSYNLNLLFFKTLSSSTQAFVNMLNAPIQRSYGLEKEVLMQIQKLADSIKVNSKTAQLIKILNKVFNHLKSLKANQKAIIFVDNAITLDTLYLIFSEAGYNTLKYKDNETLEKFRNEKNVQILVTTDTAAKGLDIEYCPVVVNYDLIYNAIEMEQRICRCHRQGQKSDVLVINMLSKENFADVRILELINKRTLQFNGIFGMSDDIVGNFDTKIQEVLHDFRHRDDIAQSFKENLAINKTRNEEIVSNAEDVLFTTFTKSIADKITVTPQYMQDKIDELNSDLWNVTKYFFSKRKDYEIDEDAKTITCTSDELPHLFYYCTGSRNKPYIGLKQYGLGKDFKPYYGRISYTSPLAKGVLAEVECFESGEITVDADIEPCEIGFYRVNLTFKNEIWRIKSGSEIIPQTPIRDYYSVDILTGRTQSGKILTDEQCRELLTLNILDCTEIGGKTAYWLSSVTGGSMPHPLDRFVPTNELIQKYIDKRSSALAEEIERIKLRAANKKAKLENSLNGLHSQIKTLNKTSDSGDRLEELKNQKQIKVLEKELKQREQTMFLEKIKIDVALETEIEAITATDKFSARSKCMFVVRLRGNSATAVRGEV